MGAAPPVLVPEASPEIRTAVILASTEECPATALLGADTGGLEDRVNGGTSAADPVEISADVREMLAEVSGVPVVRFGAAADVAADGSTSFCCEVVAAIADEGLPC